MVTMSMLNRVVRKGTLLLLGGLLAWLTVAAAIVPQQAAAQSCAAASVYSEIYYTHGTQNGSDFYILHTFASSTGGDPCVLTLTDKTIQPGSWGISDVESAYHYVEASVEQSITSSSDEGDYYGLADLYVGYVPGGTASSGPMNIANHETWYKNCLPQGNSTCWCASTDCFMSTAVCNFPNFTLPLSSCQVHMECLYFDFNNDKCLPAGCQAQTQDPWGGYAPRGSQHRADSGHS